MLYYKVVYDNNGTLLSATTRDYEPYAVTYKINKWTKPLNSKSRLFVFDTLDNAQHYFEYFLFNNNFSIYRCEVKAPSEVTPLVPGVFQQFDNFWNNQPASWTCTPPQGTILAKAVKLIEIQTK